MSLTKQEMIQSIYKRYGVLFATDAKEKDVINAFAGKYHRLEVLNISKRGKPGKFNASELTSTSRDDLRRLAQKYAKRSIPSNVSRDTVIKILLNKINPEKLDEKELIKFGKFDRSPAQTLVNLYAGWIPKVKKRIEKKDIEKGKRVAGWYKR